MAKLRARYVTMIDAYFTNGFAKVKAAEAAGFRNAGSNAHRLFQREDVQAEIEKRNKRLAKKHDITQEYLIERWKKTVDAKVFDVLEIDDEGNATIDMRKLTPELEFGLSEFIVEEYQEGRGEEAKQVKRIKFKQLDRLRAMEGLARIGGFFSETVKHDIADDLVKRINAGQRRVSSVKQEQGDEEGS